jgi:hypothetical protein
VIQALLAISASTKSPSVAVGRTSDEGLQHRVVGSLLRVESRRAVPDQRDAWISSQLSSLLRGHRGARIPRGKRKGRESRGDGLSDLDDRVFGTHALGNSDASVPRISVKGGTLPSATFTVRWRGQRDSGAHPRNARGALRCESSRYCGERRAERPIAFARSLGHGRDGSRRPRCPRPRPAIQARGPGRWDQTELKSPQSHAAVSCGIQECLTFGPGRRGVPAPGTDLRRAQGIARPDQEAGRVRSSLG